jgi:hypothetical protein
VLGCRQITRLSDTKIWQPELEHRIAAKGIELELSCKHTKVDYMISRKDQQPNDGYAVL